MTNDAWAPLRATRLTLAVHGLAGPARARWRWAARRKALWRALAARGPLWHERPGAGPLVADALALRRGGFPLGASRVARPGRLGRGAIDGAARAPPRSCRTIARALWRAHARAGLRRGYRRRLLGPVRRAYRVGDAWSMPTRLFRRGTRRRAVRPARSGGASARGSSDEGSCDARARRRSTQPSRTAPCCPGRGVRPKTPAGACGRCIRCVRGP